MFQVRHQCHPSTLRAQCQRSARADPGQPQDSCPNPTPPNDDFVAALSTPLSRLRAALGRPLGGLTPCVSRFPISRESDAPSVAAPFSLLARPCPLRRRRAHGGRQKHDVARSPEQETPSGTAHRKVLWTATASRRCSPASSGLAGAGRRVGTQAYGARRVVCPVVERIRQQKGGSVLANTIATVLLTTPFVLRETATQT